MAAPTTRLTLQKAGTLSSGHLKLMRKPSKRRNGPIFTMTKTRNDGQRFREMKVGTRNIGGVAERREKCNLCNEIIVYSLLVKLGYEYVS